jgi:hypothetical protein
MVPMEKVEILPISVQVQPALLLLALEHRATAVGTLINVMTLLDWPTAFTMVKYTS